jgi:hypothetical protein
MSSLSLSLEELGRFEVNVRLEDNAERPSLDVRSAPRNPFALSASSIAPEMTSTCRYQSSVYFD